MLEGGETVGLVIVIELPSAQQARDFYGSAAHAPLLQLHLACAQSAVAIVASAG